MKTIYRIHGDNIMECEVATSVILESISFATGSRPTTELVDSISFTPSFSVKFENGLTFILEYFPGHNRWNVSLPDYLAQRGALLRESVDAFVTLVQEDTEIPVAAFEFCNALPAGNNAWQRAGRALAITGAGIPYFYFAEIGGQELDSDRNIKAPRFPNPIVPFSYLSISSAAPDKCTTVYMASRSISKDTYEEFKEVLANSEYKRAIASLFTGEDVSDESLNSSKQKSARFVFDLAQRRKRSNTHSLETWQKMLHSASSGSAVAPHLLNDELAWNKKISIPANDSLSKLVDLLKNNHASAIGSNDMPFCILPKTARDALANKLQKIYRDTVSQEFLEWLSAGQKDLVLIFIAGFKPRGDDSRPDRGLVPMAKMVFANDDIDLLTVVYGPAKQNTWERLFSNPTQLAKTNGLWEAIVGLSDAVLVDSVSLNLTGVSHRDVLLSAPDTTVNDILLQRFANLPRFGEHDVDTVLHMIFSNSEEHGVFEALCNPPGGDWSGVSFLDNEKATNRWTSLPRVTGLDGKRPDHIIQFFADKKITWVCTSHH